MKHVVRGEDAVWRVIVDYKYWVGSKQFSGSLKRVSARKRPSEQLAKQYLELKNVSVHYHPNNPQISVLIPGITWDDFGIFMAGVGFFTIGLFILWFR